MTDLREELRLIGCHANGDARCTCNIGQDALALIDSQAAEIERLTVVAAANKEAAEGEARNCDEAVARADALEAERDALRDALRSIEGMAANATGAPMTAERWLDRIEERARAALGGQP